MRQIYFRRFIQYGSWPRPEVTDFCISEGTTSRWGQRCKKSALRSLKGSSNLWLRHTWFVKYFFLPYLAWRKFLQDVKIVRFSITSYSGRYFPQVCSRSTVVTKPRYHLTIESDCQTSYKMFSGSALKTCLHYRKVMLHTLWSCNFQLVHASSLELFKSLAGVAKQLYLKHLWAALIAMQYNCKQYFPDKSFFQTPKSWKWAGAQKTRLCCTHMLLEFHQATVNFYCYHSRSE